MLPPVLRPITTADAPSVMSASGAWVTQILAAWLLTGGPGDQFPQIQVREAGARIGIHRLWPSRCVSG